MNLQGKRIADAYQYLLILENGYFTDGTGSIVNNIQLTASNACTAALANMAWAALLADTASLAVTASYAKTGVGGGTTLTTASTYQITASRAISASWAPSSGGGTTLVTASTYPITSSNSISASWSSNTLSASFSITSSFAANSGTSTSASYSQTSSFAINATPLITASTYPITSSQAVISSTSSYADNFRVSGSLSLSGLSSSLLVTGSTYLSGTTYVANPIKIIGQDLNGNYMPIIFDAGTNVSSIFYNPSHASAQVSQSGGIPGELQITCGGQISINAGYNSQGNSIIQMGSTPAYHDWIVIQHDGSGNTSMPSYQLGYSKFLVFCANYMSASFLNDGAYMAQRMQVVDNQGNCELEFYTKIPTHSGKQKEWDDWFNAKRIGAVTTKGWRLLGQKEEGVTVVPTTPTASFTVDFSTNTYIDLTATQNLSFSHSNFPSNYPRIMQETRTLIPKVLIVKSGTSARNFIYPTTWIPVGTTSLPATMSANSIMTLKLTPFDATNCLVEYSGTGSYTLPTDTTANLFITNSSITDYTLQRAIHTLCIDLKNYGLFNKLVACYPFIGANSASCAVDLINNAHPITWVNSGSINFSSLGIQCDGTSSYGNTGVSPNTSFTTPSSSMYLISIQGTSSYVPSPGWLTGATGFGLVRGGLFTTANSIAISGLNSQSDSDQSAFLGSTADFRGIITVNRMGVSQSYSWQNLTDTQYQNVSGVTGFSQVPIFIGCRNAQGTPSNFSNAIIGFAAYGQTMSRYDMINLITIVKNFNVNTNKYFQPY